MDFTALAQELVETTSSMVGGRTINVMNLEGVIIASSERKRIGNIHEGAREVIRTGKPVAIKKCQLPSYPGAKEGYNMPIRSKDAIIGVVGIFGNPEEIIDTANLLEMYVAKFFQLEAILNQRLVEGELRGSLLRLLLSLTEADMGRVTSVINGLQIHLEPPMRVVVMSLPQEEMGADPHVLMGTMPDKMLRANLLNPSSDVWGMASGRLVLVKSSMNENVEVFRRDIGTLLENEQISPRLSVGSLCFDMKGIQNSYQEAVLLDECSSQWFNDIMRLEDHCEYMLFKTVKQEWDSLAALYERLKQELGKEEIETSLQTAACYYGESRSVARAAAKLYIHKNTLQYRLRRVLDILGLSSCSGFYQEYMMRLLIIYHNSKPGRQA